MIQEKQLINNRFLVVKPLSQGGFGETFEIDDNGTRKVLKILHHFSDREKQQKAITLFLREADVLMQLNHPGIPHVEPDGYFTFSEGNITRYGLVMEKIDGKTLQEWLQENSEQPISQELAIDWLKQLISILEYLHKNNYFHRDIKPSNIMIKPDGTLVLIDFGSVKELTGSYLAKLVEDGEATKLYTPGYAPKEQIEGKPLPQSDFFALGCTFVYLLTGKSLVNIPRDDLTDSLIWRNLAPNIGDLLGNLIDDFMAVLPTQRPQNTHEIWQRITEIESVIFAHQKCEKVRRLPSLTPNKNLINMVKIGVIGVVLGGAITFPAVPEIAVFCNDQGVKNHVNNPLGIAELSYKCAITLQSNYAKPHYNLGSLYQADKKFDQAEKEYLIALSFSPNFALAFNNLARLYMRREKYEKAIPLLKKALDLPQSNETQYALNKNLALVLLKQGLNEEAKIYVEKAIALDPQRAVAYCVRAKLLAKEGGHSNAEWEQCMRNAPNDSSLREDTLILLP